MKFKDLALKGLTSSILLGATLGFALGEKKSLAEDFIDSINSNTQYNHSSIDWGYWFEAPVDFTIEGASYPKAIELGQSYYYEIWEVDVNNMIGPILSLSDS